jgi:hypothetical protein
MRRMGQRDPRTVTPLSPSASCFTNRPIMITSMAAISGHSSTSKHTCTTAARPSTSPPFTLRLICSTASWISVNSHDGAHGGNL